MIGFKELGKNIRYYRKKQKISKKIIAKQIGFSIKKYNQIENGNTVYNFTTLEKIANILQINLPELLDFTQQKFHL